MRDLNVEIGVGADYCSVLVYQGSKSPHNGGGVRVLHHFYVPRGELAHSSSTGDVLSLIGRYLAQLDRRNPAKGQLELEGFGSL